MEKGERGGGFLGSEGCVCDCGAMQLTNILPFPKTRVPGPGPLCDCDAPDKAYRTPVCSE